MTDPIQHVREAELCEDDAIEFVVAFGSWVRADTHAGSDVDIAVQFADHLDDRERFRQRYRLSGALQLETGAFIDVSDLEALPIEVAHDAIQGELLCGDETTFRERKQALETADEDQRETLEDHHRAVINRIASEGLRGWARRRQDSAGS